MLARLWSALFAVLLLQTLSHGAAEARMMSKADLKTKQAAAMERFNTLSTAPGRASGTGVKNITFSNPRASGSCHKVTYFVER